MARKCYRLPDLDGVDCTIRGLVGAHPSEVEEDSELVLEMLDRKREEVRVARADRRDGFREKNGYEGREKPRQRY